MTLDEMMKTVLDKSTEDQIVSDTMSFVLSKSHIIDHEYTGPGGSPNTANHGAGHEHDDAHLSISYMMYLTGFLMLFTTIILGVMVYHQKKYLIIETVEE